MIKHKIPQHSKKQRARRQREKRNAAAVAEFDAHDTETTRAPTSEHRTGC